ncbi:MAG: transcription-repair coupling factor [Prevotellaceae bacterium]|jgi:transcription-repair coupling factor (superfamily II helicase)|nr:transcription-repair coupling factor [Prevotellaceae bacterium]
MDAQTLVGQFAAQEACRQLHAHVAANDGGVISVRGLHGSARTLAAAALFSAGTRNTVDGARNTAPAGAPPCTVHRTPDTVLYVAPDRDAAEYRCHDLCLWCDPDRVFFLPSSFRRSIEYGQPDASNRVLRTAALNALRHRGQCMVVTFPEALAELVVSREEMARRLLPLHAGERISMDFLCDTLLSCGFSRVDFVTEPGQYAVRGSIIDVFSFAGNLPCRIDFFGNEVESIRTFGVNTQLSEQLLPEMEIIADVREAAGDAGQATLFEFAGPATVWVEEWKYTLGVLERLWEKEALRGRLMSPETLRTAAGDGPLTAGKESMVVFTAGAEHGAPRTAGRAPLTVRRLSFGTSPQPAFNKNFELLAADITAHAEQGYRTFIFSENSSQATRLQSIFSSITKEPVPFEFVSLTPHEGFIDHTLRCCWYTDHQLFERYHRAPLRRAVEKSERLTWQEFSGMQAGDYIVHVDHGIGVFGGLVKINVDGKIQEAVRLIYRDNDILFVNIHGLHRIAKYKSRDSEPPKINKLGSAVWQNMTQSAKRRVKDIARELIVLYARRKNTRGFAFAADSYMQHELEASFVYEDTPDQLKATEDVKADMERPCPMDRLICGDVGFGKTEVAVRAAFKAAADGKQVAVLVPTTILALQHYKTFSARLAGFPVTVDYVSRLRAAGQVKKTLEALEQGQVDIVIGTHRLLGKDVRFKDLGLLVVDEEQKFGVAAKEKLRRLKLHVDTLAMTATPIPRTLQFSLMGARDLSLIHTPPPNRHPIATEVHPFHERIIRDAIRCEVQRGGQVFFVHNRVQDIQAMADTVRRICPEASVGVGHGQMPPEELEKVILEFMSGDFDVLLCTTIIENGLDIPNANTIIVNGAQNFGLSDLHQLRGRVGRSNRKAFCYLLAPPPAALTDDARRRLNAIETFSELGSGFNIAMQDLDIRGAGNILGGEQSGFIADIGFETYRKILDEALAELNSELPADGAGNEAGSPASAAMEVADCAIDTDMEILIPDSYVGNATEKLRLYKELDNITDEPQLQKMIAELTDRFGALPPEVEQLCNIVRLRRTAMSLGFEKITLKNRLMVACFVSNQLSHYYRSPLFARILGYIQEHPKTFTVKEQHHKLFLTVKNVPTVHRAIEVLKDF